MNAMQRAKAILTNPLAEWDRIARESEDPAAILMNYVAPLAVIPSLFGFIGACLIGVIGKDGTVLRAPLVDGMFGAIFGYVMACAIVLVLALGVYVLAPLFGGRAASTMRSSSRSIRSRRSGFAESFCCCLACISSRCSVFTASICYGLARRG